MRHSITALLTAVAFAALTSCGQMGPLYMPSEETPPEQSAEPSGNSQQPVEES
jgi:predicted small lipoprotein YifL